MVTVLSLVLLGFAVGTFGTLVGIGGGIILVPIFLLLMHYSPQHTVGTSLAVVFFNALSGSFAYIKQKKVFYDAGIRFSLATLPGAFAGSYLATYFTSKTFSTSFGALLVVIAFVMFYRSAGKQITEPDFDKTTFQYNRTLGVLFSIVVGFLSSILGIGGGVIHVPILIYLLGFPTHVAYRYFSLCPCYFELFRRCLSLYSGKRFIGARPLNWSWGPGRGAIWRPVVAQAKIPPNSHSSVFGNGRPWS